jgi:methylglutaconyl-CoA hydratase
LFSKVFGKQEEMDKELEIFTEKLAQYNPEAMEEWKKVLWEGTGNWDTLLTNRAEITGRLAISEETKKALEKFKNN